MKKRAFLCASALACAAVVAVPASALTLEDAVSRSLKSHPELARQEARARAAAASRDAESLAPPVILGAEAENVFGSDGLSGIDGAETTLQLSRVIERGNKADLRRRAGQAALTGAELEVALQRNELIAETARRFIDVVVAQARRQVAADQVHLVDELLARVERRVSAGRAFEAETRRARMERARARATLARVVEGDLPASRARLVALWGESTPRFNQAAAKLFNLPSVPAVEVVVRELERNPELRRLEVERQIASAQAELARAQRRPDINVSLGARYLNELDSGALVLGFSLPLGTRSRAAPEIRAAEHRIRASELALEAQRRELIGLVGELAAQLDARRTQLRLLNEAVIPEARAAVDLYQEGYESGRYSFVALADAHRQLIDARGDAVELAGEFHRLLIELERLTQAVGDEA